MVTDHNSTVIRFKSLADYQTTINTSMVESTQPWEGHVTQVLNVLF